MPKVAIIKNYSKTIRLLKTVLEKEGCLVSSHLSDDFGLEKRISDCQPDIVLLDIDMPYYDGFQILDCLKNDIETKDVPTILVSVSNELDIIKEFLWKGAVDYIVKPFSVGRIISAIVQHLPKV